jgi:heterodisulfide reductase subunit C
MSKVDPDFVEKISGFTGFNAYACMNCGSCTALCPMGIDLLPRRIFRHVLLGLEDKVLENTEGIFSCLLCKMCEETCPKEVPIVENIKSIRWYINCDIFKLGKD